MAMVEKSFAEIINAYTRPTNSSRFNEQGALEVIGPNVPQLDFDPVTLQPRGLGVWEQRTNSIRNNTMQGTVAGIPGTMPTNWAASAAAPLNGISRQVVGTGVENGIEYVDVRFYGTATASAYLDINFDTANVTAANGQTWNLSVFAAVVAGSLTGFTSPSIIQYGIPALSDNGTRSLSGLLSSGQLKSQRYDVTKTYSTAITGISPRFAITASSGATVDVTIRIGLPQLEQGAFATPVIKTSGTAVTRAADNAVIDTLSPWFSAAEGTIVVEWQNYDLFSATIYQFDNGTNPNAIRARYGAAGNSNDSVVLIGGTAQGGINSRANQQVVGTVYRNAHAYKVGLSARSANGDAVTSGSAAAIPSVSVLRLGMNANLIEQVNGYIRSFRHYPSSPPEAVLRSFATL